MKKIICLLIIINSYSLIVAQAGLHGYISSWPSSTPPTYGEGFGFYSAIWPLIETPLANFQIGLPSTWIIPNNADNTSSALCPNGTYARDHWPSWGPTWDGVFQTVEGGPGYWAGNRFHYASPKFKMNSTPSCYDVEISTPGWPFFWSDSPVPDSVLGIAQLSNHILYPPDGMTFDGSPNGDFLGISYMSLPLTSPYTDAFPVGEKNWTCFLNAQNFRGPLAYYVPETWAKISKNYSFDYGRGLDARSSKTNLSGGTMEINTVPELIATDDSSNTYYKIPKLQFPVDATNRTILSKDVRFYNKTALYNRVLSWKNGGPVAASLFDTLGSRKPTMSTGAVSYDQDNIPIIGINELAVPVVIANNAFGFQWSGSYISSMRSFPQYYKDSAGYRVAIDSTMIPASAASLITSEFAVPDPNPTPYEALLVGAWATPGPTRGPFYAYLKDSSKLTYYWYRFIDQPVFQQFSWSSSKKDSLQNLIIAMHASWTSAQNYMPPISSGNLVAFDPGLLINPPAGLELGYVPIVTKQEKGAQPAFINNFSGAEISSVVVYPNPSSGQFRISKEGAKIKSVEVYDLLGHRIFQSFFNNNQVSINLENSTQGICFIKIIDSQEMEINKKIVIE